MWDQIYLDKTWSAEVQTLLKPFLGPATFSVDLHTMVTEQPR